MKVKVKKVEQVGDSAKITIEIGKGQDKELLTYSFSILSELNLDNLKAKIKPDLVKKQKFRARVGELKNLIGKDLDL